jgi:hypothetical protein
MRFVLAPPPTREQLDAAMRSQKWRLSNIVPTGGPVLAHFLYLTEDKRATIQILFDSVLSAAYVQLGGPGVARAAEQVRAALPVLTGEVISQLVAAAENPQQALRALSFSARAAVTDEEKEEAEQRVRRAMAHPDAGVRWAAVASVGYLDAERAKRLLAEAKSQLQDVEAVSLAERMEQQLFGAPA